MTQVSATDVVQGEVELVRRYGRQLGEIVVLGCGFAVGALMLGGAGSFVLGLL